MGDLSNMSSEILFDVLEQISWGANLWTVSNGIDPSKATTSPGGIEKTGRAS